MSKPPVILFGDFSLDEAAHYQQLGSSSSAEDQNTFDAHPGNGPPPVRFGSVDPTLHIPPSPPPLPPNAPAHPPYPTHPPPYLTGNHPPPYLQNLPPPHFAPRTFYPPVPPYFNSFGTFPHPGGHPLPYTPDYLYGRPLLPPHAYHGPVDPSHTLGLSSAPLGALPPASAPWRPHPLATPPQQPERAPHPPPGMPEFPPANQPPWIPPPLQMPVAGPPLFSHERTSSSDGGPDEVHRGGEVREGEGLPSSSGEVAGSEEDGAGEHDDGKEQGVQAPEREAEAPAPEESEKPALPEGHAVGADVGSASTVEGDAVEPDGAEPTGWGPGPSSTSEVSSGVEGASGHQDTAAAAASGKEVAASSGAEPVPVAEPGKPKSWAALVGKAAWQQVGPQPPVHAPATRTAYSGPSTQGRPLASRGREKPRLSGPAWFQLLRESPSQRLRPRGLMNTGNSCFLNSTLQALFACPPFLLLVTQLKTASLDPDEYPMLCALVTYLAQFDLLPASASPAPPRPGAPSGSMLVDVGNPFTPDMFVDVLQRFSPIAQHRGLRRPRQEDAQEFLSYVMDRMHEELLKLESAPVEAPPARTSNGPLANGAAGGPGEGEDEWETVGPKNKSAVTRMHTHTESALSSIFGGSLQSLVKTKGTKASATVQPFTIVQLDIASDVVKSVEDALQLFAAPETLDGYKMQGKTEVAASKLLKIQTLPRVLVLHLMRFSFSGERGSTKVHKPIKFPPTLTIPVKLLTAPPAPAEIRRYELVATVSHIGKDSSGGHYTADARQEDGRWLRFDDSNVSVVSLNRVLHDQAYLLLYKRVVQ